MTSLPLKHQRVQRLRRLLGRRSARLADGAFVIEGAKVLSEALDAGAAIEAIYVVEGTADPVLDRALARGVRVVDLAPGVMEKIADTVTPQPVLAVAPRIEVTLASLEPAVRAGGFVVIGVDLRDPGNAGTVIRSAEASGAVGVVLCEGSVEATNPKTVRSSAGALFHVPVVAGGAAADVLATMQGWGVRTWATAVLGDGAVVYDEADLTGPTAIVMGNEAHGLSPELTASVDALVTIPMAGRTESLNVGMATAVLCFEAARQRRPR